MNYDYRRNPSKVKVVQPPEGIPILHWIIKIVGEPTPIGTFSTAQAAETWVEEWLALKDLQKLIIPILDKKVAQDAILEAMEDDSDF